MMTGNWKTWRLALLLFVLCGGAFSTVCAKTAALWKLDYSPYTGINARCLVSPTNDFDVILQDQQKEPPSSRPALPSGLAQEWSPLPPNPDTTAGLLDTTFSTNAVYYPHGMLFASAGVTPFINSLTNSFTVEGWHFRDTTAAPPGIGAYLPFFSLGSTWADGGWSFGFYNLDDTNNLHFALYDYNDRPARRVFGTPIPTATYYKKWCHYALVYDHEGGGGLGTWEIFVNSASYGVVTNLTAPTKAGTQTTFCLGGDAGGSQYYNMGAYDTWRISDLALAPNQFLNVGTPTMVRSPKTLAFYRLDVNADGTFDLSNRVANAYHLQAPVGNSVTQVTANADQAVASVPNPDARAPFLGNLKEGPITMLSIGVKADGSFKFIIAEGESLVGPIPPTGNTNTHGKFLPDVRTFLRKWSMEGPTHHFALGIGHHAAELKKIARILGIEAVVVTPETQVASAEASGMGFAIDMPVDVKPWEKTAECELTNYLARTALNGLVRIGGGDGVVFHVGDTAFARAKGLGAESLKDEEWVIRNFGTDVVLTGGGMRGTLYAVSHFLEDEVGVRWWGDNDEDVPELRILAFDSLNRRGRPFFRCRDVYRSSIRNKSDPRTAVRNRLNENGTAGIPLAWGGEAFLVGSPGFVHTWQLYFPFEKEGKIHPKWFALVDGKRVGGNARGQMCLTCPGLKEEFIRRVENSVERDIVNAKEKGLQMPLVYDLSMNDSIKYCTCDSCMRENAKYNHSGRQLNFINDVAAAISAKHPGLMFSTLAYFHAETVPSNGVCAADNVIVKLCNSRQNMVAGISHPDNRMMFDQVQKWKDYTKNLFVWEYGHTYGKHGHGYPFPSEFNIFEKMRHYAANSVMGIMVEHEDWLPADMYALKFYLECKALENPFADSSVLIEDFMNRYYGKAGRYVLASRQYLDSICRKTKAFVSWVPMPADFTFITDKDLSVMDELYEKALSEVKGCLKYEKRVNTAQESIRRLMDFRKRFGTKHPPENGVSDKPFYDFPVTEESFMLWDRAHINFISDEEAGDVLAGDANKAVSIKADDKKKFPLPFSYGIYDLEKKTTVGTGKLEKPVGPGYHWYDLGTVTLPANAVYAYFTSSWEVQLHGGLPEMNGRTFHVKVMVKFSGPEYFPGSQEPNEIRLARVAFTE